MASQYRLAHSRKPLGWSALDSQSRRSLEQSAKWVSFLITRAGIIAQSSNPNVFDFHRKIKRAMVVKAVIIRRIMIHIVTSHFLWLSLMVMGGGLSAEDIAERKL
jgi:hypothetical protein